MQRHYAKRKVGGKQIEHLKGDAGIDSRVRRPAHSGFAVSKGKTHQRTIPANKIWISSTVLSKFFRPWSSPWAPVLAFGASINLLEGYGNDNPGAKSQGMKQFMAN